MDGNWLDFTPTLIKLVLAVALPLLGCALLAGFARRAANSEDDSEV